MKQNYVIARGIFLYRYDRLRRIVPADFLWGMYVSSRNEWLSDAACDG